MAQYARYRRDIVAVCLTCRSGGLGAQAYIERTEGAKTFAVGPLADEGGVTVEAEGVFIHPKQ